MTMQARIGIVFAVLIERLRNASALGTDDPSRGEGHMPLVFRPKLHKTVELLVRLAEIQPDTSKYRAVKYVYLADAEHFGKHGRPITFDAYYALPSGPVAINALNLIEGHAIVLQAAGLTELPFETYRGIEGGKATTFVGRPRRPLDGDQLSVSDIAVFDRIVTAYKDKSFIELKAETHDHEAFKKAWEGRGKRSQKALMDYADMLPDGPYKETLLEDLAPIANKI